MLLVVEVYVDYGSVNVFHVCLDFCVVYGVGVCVNVCWSLCQCMLFVSYVWVLFAVLRCSVVGIWGVVIFVLSVMRIIGGVPL